MMSGSRRFLFSFAFLAILAPVVAAVLTPAIYILAEGEVESEDVYVATSSARINGTIDGDLVIAAGAVTIGGDILGDVFAVSHSRVEINGTVTGSVRALSRELVISGSVEGDVVVAGGSLNIEGSVGRDVLVVAGSTTLTGSAGRDVLGRFLEAEIDGAVGRDVDVSVRNLRVGPRTDVGGDLLYRADDRATISGGAQVAGQLERLPSRAVFIVRVWLIGATILGFLAFVASGFVLFVVFRSTMCRATGLVRTETWRTMWVGVLAVLALPLLSVIFVFTVVGAPIGILLALLWLLGLVFAPVPAVAAGGDVILRGKAGVLAAFLVGAVIWRLGIWLLPVVGLLLYTAALAAGTGGLVIAAWRQRRAGSAGAPRLLPPPLTESPDSVPEDWEPPLAPVRQTARETEPADESG